MTEQIPEQRWKSVKRVRLLAQPIGIGIPMALCGGIVGWNMLLAFDLKEPIWLQLSTVALILAFGVLFALGVCNLLAPFERIWAAPGELQLRLGKIVLRRIPESKIRSVGGTSWDILVRNDEIDLYRIKLRCEGTFPRHLWMDWTVATEELLRENLTHTLFLI